MKFFIQISISAAQLRRIISESEAVRVQFETSISLVHKRVRRGHEFIPRSDASPREPVRVTFEIGR